MNGVDQRDWYEKKVKPHWKLSLALELVCLPVMWAGLWYGLDNDLAGGVFMGLAWLLFDVAHVAVMGHSLGGVYVQGSPFEEKDLRIGKTVKLFGILALILCLLAAVFSLQPAIIVSVLCLIGCISLGWLALQPTVNRRLLGVAAAALLLIPPLAIATLISNFYVQVALVVIDAVWACFVLLGVIRLTAGRKVPGDQ